ncbi:hypothetical protein PspLS_05884 [Pyricularia sp. CBS 133598]|nr:hypothetical protein PspLS_05884 [Pyricularia sp. CBS 133598]
MRFAALVTVFVASAIAAPVNFAASNTNGANTQGTMRRRNSLPDVSEVLDQPAAVVQRSPEPEPNFFRGLTHKFRGVANFAKGAVGVAKTGGGTALGVAKGVGGTAGGVVDKFSGVASIIGGGPTGALMRAATSGFLGKSRTASGLLGGLTGGGGGGGGAKPGGIGAAASLIGGVGPMGLLRQAAASGLLTKAAGGLRH